MKTWKETIGLLEKQPEFLLLREKLTQIDITKGLICAVSGGVDSMLLVHLVLSYLQSVGADLSLITLVHCNHQQRNESKLEELFIRQYFTDCTVVTSEWKGEKATERDLRKWRWNFFEETLFTQKAVYITTGHNLTDRLETTIMNSERGSGLLGFLNMTQLDNTYLYPPDGGVVPYSIFRPLLELPKSYIYQLAERAGMPYFEDTTNQDSTVSYRNEVRKKISSELSTSNLPYFYTGLQRLYERLENNLSKLEETSLQPSQFWGDDLPYFSSPPPSNRQELTGLLSRLKIYSGPTKATIGELYTFLATEGGGRKYYAGRYLFRGYKKSYYIKAPEKFRERYIELEQSITQPGIYTMGDFKRDVPARYVGGRLRFPKRGDKYKGKSLMKRLSNQKVPIFWRKYIPVIEHDSKLVAVLPLKDRSEYFW